MLLGACSNYAHFVSFTASPVYALVFLMCNFMLVFPFACHVSLCVPLYPHVTPCILVYPRCIRMYPRVSPCMCIPVYPSVFPCIPILAVRQLDDLACWRRFAIFFERKRHRTRAKAKNIILKQRGTYRS